MPIDFLPSGDEALETWGMNFDTKITSTPTAYGLLAADATVFHGLMTDYIAKLAAALNPGTKTKVTVSAKNISRAALRAKARALAKIVNAYPGTTNPMREDLGLHPRDATPTPVPPPSTRPIVTIDNIGGLRLVDETTPTRRGKPAGVIGAHVFARIGPASDPPPVSRDDAPFFGLATRTTGVEIPIPPGSNGKTLWVLAQWVNEKGEDGPLSAVASTTIAA